MSRSARGLVINIHQYGATVRLEDGTLAVAAAAELATNRPAYVASRDRRTPLLFVVDPGRRHPCVMLARETAPSGPAPLSVPQLIDPEFERRIGAYLKETEEWAPPDRPAPADRHFIRKKRRAAFFEARNRLA